MSISTETSHISLCCNQTKMYLLKLIQYLTKYVSNFNIMWTIYYFTYSDSNSPSVSSYRGCSNEIKNRSSDGTITQIKTSYFISAMQIVINSDSEQLYFNTKSSNVWHWLSSSIQSQTMGRSHEEIQQDHINLATRFSHI